ncbi:putative Major facilitator superfamily protein [Hibiscus syriacus]|uniref:Major facilitator superfamily protein n=1 Tax=Hibiscus syriacus TaxID=106335 RepID=A0A6A2YKU1_HIBSY|nr:heparan-alpha-glucosaminide N-acetyltransferase-like [Hibiscus syriacus]KAE8679387.1 putative Major facilitator superfamily protein [Hibiscus syriacus]
MADPGKMEEGLARSKVDHAGEDIENMGKKEDKLVEEQQQLQLQERQQQQPPLVKQKTKRIATLDAFRGLTIVLMILVDDAGGAYARIDHSPWNGCTLADYVMPFFLFIVGVAIALALKKIPKVKDAIRKICLRTLKLLFWGVLLQGGYSHAPNDLVYGVDMKQIRWCGILQRIALVYFIVALIETLTTKLRPTVLKPGYSSIFTAYRWQWFGGFIAFVIYMVTTYSLYVPDWSFVVKTDDKTTRYTVKCGMRGHLGPACNAVGYVDREVWGINHLYAYPVWQRLKACTHSSPSAGPFREDAPSWCRAPFEPEGLLSSISAILSGTIGIHYGHILIHFKGHSERLKQWVPMALGLLIVAIILHFTDAIPINKQLYSFSYVCFTAGAAGIVFSAFYILIDVWGLRTPFLFLEWIGMNAMLIYVLGAQGILPAFVNGWYYESTNNTLVFWIQKHIFNNVWHSVRLGTLLYVIFAEIVFYGVLSGILHKLGIYWKL